MSDDTFLNNPDLSFPMCVDENHLWLPELEIHNHMEKTQELALRLTINRGDDIFDIQVWKWTGHWYWVDTGSDGHCVKGWDNVVQVLERLVSNIATGDHC